MTDRTTTVGALKRAVIDMCRRKGWGEDGIQHPQHIAMAMMVETCEVLEHFIEMTPDAERELICGGALEKKAAIAEEISDVMMYGLQIMYTLDVDVSAGFGDGLSDAYTPITELKARAGIADGGPVRGAMRVVFEASGMLESFQFQSEDNIRLMIAHGLSDERREIGCAFIKMFRQILKLANLIDFDITEQIMRKIAIVDRRVYSADEPAR